MNVANVTVLVCGGRTLDPMKVSKWLEACLMLAVSTALEIDMRNLRIGAIIEGNARGADEGAGFYAIDYNIPHMQFPADWMNEGLSAGNNRNRRMLLEARPHIVIAFPGKKGTANMVDQARKAAIPVYQVVGNFEFVVPVKNRKNRRGL